MSASHDVDIDKHVRVYITVFVSLMALTVFTVWVGYQNLPIGQAVAVALLIASIKGGLVASYFMHLISERKLIYAVLVSTVALFAVLLVVPMLTVNDGTMVEHPGGVVHTVVPAHEGGHEGGAEGTPEATPEAAPAAAPESGAAPESTPPPAAAPTPGGAQPEPSHN
ncbi:MAG TPA: cytochrome C oxidase subunit IV family protein [Candidatus Polarisedimenticolia bacterium]|nr:cytochrome C oxidase subunit IV family protein [Candidatus Polarisedimenticolia bacterium]